MLRRWLLPLIFLAVLAFPFAAFAQVTVPPSPDDVGAFVSALFGAVAGKQWGYLIALAVMALVFGARKFGARISPKVEEFLHSDPGGVLLALLVSFATALAAASLAPGAIFTWAIVLAAFKTALVAMGGFALINKLGAPLFGWLFSKLYPNGKEQAAQVVAEAQAHESAANAKPADPGSAAGSLEQIK